MRTLGFILIAIGVAQAAPIGISDASAYIHASGGLLAQLDQASPGYFTTLDGNNLGIFGWTFKNTTGSKLTNVRLFGLLDADIDRDLNTFFNEYGEFLSLTLPSDAPSGAIAASFWQIDEPGFVYGTILNDLAAGSLLNANFVSSATPDDTSLALGFLVGDLVDGQTATITLRISTAVGGGLRQIDPDSDFSFYLNGYAALDLVDPPPPQPSEVPEPSTWALCGAVLLLALAMSRKRSGRPAMKLPLAILGMSFISLSAYAQADLAIAGLDATLVNTDSQTLRISGVLRATLTNIGTAATAGRFRVVAFEDTNRNANFDATQDRILGSAEYSDPISIGAKPILSIPLAGTVAFRGNVIYLLADSDSAIAETSEANNLYSTAQNSSRAPGGPFAPSVKWFRSTFTQRPDSDQVMMTPAVVDLNNDAVPDIVFSTFTGANYFNGAILRAVSGRDGAQLWSVTDTRYLLVGAAGVTVGDIDGDGRSEIMAVHESRGLIAFEHDGTFKWLSPTLPGGQQWGSASLADLDHDGTPEIIFGATVLKNDGTILWQGNRGLGDNFRGSLSLVADLDLDGNPEIVAGNTAYRSDGSVYWFKNTLYDGFNAVANFNSDPYPEVVLVAFGSVSLLSHQGDVIWGPVALPGGGYGGAPTIADFDGDGRLEIGVAGALRYVVFRDDGTIKWQAVTQDGSSFMTGSSVFDFDGDGSAEVVYGDEVALRIYRGSDGTVLYTFIKSSGTTYELPLIVDVDADGKADIVVTANGGPQNGIYVISATNWVNTRRIWNQHTYHITNINDDGTIPRYEQANWLIPGLNNYRLNTFTKAGQATAAPDFTTSFIRKSDSAFPSSVSLTARIGNGGQASPSSPPNVSLSFYRGDPAAGGTLIGRAQTSKTLGPGEYEDVSVTWPNPPTGLQSVFVVADDPAVIDEGDETNNKAATQILLGSGPFPLVDGLLTRQKDRSVDLSWTAVSGATGYNIYRRTNTSSLQLVRANQPGISFADTGLTNGAPVFYTVRWLNAQGLESADGTEASATPTPTGATGANPPTILSRASTRAVVGQVYSYAFRASDPDAGTLLSYSLVSPPAGMTISSTGLINWTPTQAQAGYTRIQVRVQDNTARFATQSFSLFSEIQTIINNPPVITSTPIRTGISATLYAYQVVGSDPDGSFLRWSLDAAPLGMTINQATGLIQWTPTRDHVGTQNVTARVTDIGGLSATQAFAIIVGRGNRGPIFTSSALTLSRAGELYRYPATASDPENDPLTFSLVSGPPGMVVAPASGLVTWTPPANAANTNASVTLRVVDNGNLAATQVYTLLTTPPNQPPLISSTAVTSAAIGSTYLYTVSATDPNLPNEQLNFSLTASPAGMSIQSGTGLIQWVPPANLVNTSQNVTVRVVDLGGLTATQSFVIQVGPAGSDRPFVSLISPVNGATLTADTPIIGTATGPNLRLWRVEYQRAGDTEWFPLTSGTTPVTNGSLGTLPATLIANDAYRLRLYAENLLGNITTPDIGANVDTKQLKMGDFTLAFEDLRVPGFTFPISILRKYDTKRPQSGDFGRGWTLGFSEVDVRLDPNRNVFLTLPDARRVSFNYAPECLSPFFGGCFFSAFKTVYTAQNGVYDKLESLDCPTTVAGACELGGAFQARRWLLTTKEGLKYTIDSGKITRMEDRAGNWMQIAPTGITTNTGRNVVIERNAQGLITRINEPSPGGGMRYEYDAQGRLVRWINLSAKITTYFYENAGFPHYLTKIVDPLGRNALRNVFNAEGRLVAQCDAAGDINTLVGCSQFNPQPGTKTFTAINGRGFRTDLITDDRGNVLSERRFTDAVNYLETLRTYDAKNNTLTERDPEGNVRTFTYDASGNRLTEADPGGRTTTYTYAAGCDKVDSVRDPAGNVTRNTYDSQCNLRFVQDALLHTTEYRYSAFGQRTQMIDPNGTTWTWNYLPNGLLQNVVDPFGKATTFSFDNKGNLVSRTDRNGRRIDFQYDASNRLMRETWDNGRVSTFGYDDMGALLAAADPDSSLTMVYDNLGRLQSVDNLGTPGAPRVILTYSHDANGNTSRVQDSIGGVADYSYDGLDRLTRVTQSGSGVQPKRVDMSYTSASLLMQIKRYSDLTGTQGVANTIYEYSCGGCPGRLTAIRHRKASNNSVIHDMTFTHDIVGNIVNSSDAEGSHSYVYDPVRRLLSATHPAGGAQPNELYTYDGVGNRLTSHMSYAYTYSWQMQGIGNRLLEDSQFIYQYDAEGNLTKRIDRQNGQSYEYQYDHRRRLISTVNRDSSGLQQSRTISAFDSLNRRIHTMDGLNSTYFIYDHANPMITVGQSGTILNRRLYSRSLDGILADEQNANTRWFLLDQVGTSRDLISNLSAISTHYVHDSFGRTLVVSDSASNTLVYTGRELKKDGSYHFRYREYDPRTARFFSEDQVSPFGYGYANSPLMQTDRTGLATMLEYLAVTSTFVPLIAEAGSAFVQLRTAAREKNLCLAGVHSVADLGVAQQCDVAFEAKVSKINWDLSSSLTWSFIQTALTFRLPGTLADIIDILSPF